MSLSPMALNDPFNITKQTSWWALCSHKQQACSAGGSPVRGWNAGQWSTCTVGGLSIAQPLQPQQQQTSQPLCVR